MKLVVFAHTPPPHHGQSYMVQLMLEGFGGDHRKKNRSRNPAAEKYGITCYHVNARLSRDLEDIGELRSPKLFLLLGYCLSAIWCRFRYGAKTLYYIPAPGKRSALFRDWLVMFLCRPFFQKIILHWHAAGLAKWLETVVQIGDRSLTYKFLKQADLSIVLSKYNRADAEKLLPKQIAFVANGIPDPCPDFDENLLPLHRTRRDARLKIAAGESPVEEKTFGDARTFRVLYLAHCTREKGVFDAMAGVLKANEKLAAQNSPFTMKLQIAGGFFDAAEEAEFRQILAQSGAAGIIEYLGFVSGVQKDTALRNADLFCFPTYYGNENQPVNLIEAMAYGLPVLTTRWRSIPELLPRNYPGLVEIRSPKQVADALIQMMTGREQESLREIFLKNFTLPAYLQNLADAFHGAPNETEIFFDEDSFAPQKFSSAS